VCDPSDIDYLVVNHVEMDHSGSVGRVMDVAPEATIVTSAKGREGLEHHYDAARWDFELIDSGEELSLGERSLTFVYTPMVHWPDSMVSYVQQESLLFSNDAFGQHIAGHERFDDEVGWDLLHEEAGKYYANIVMPYGMQVLRALQALEGLKIDMIAPSHGVIWRTFIEDLLDVYPRWAGHETNPEALIVYDTMWDSTRQLSTALRRGLEESGVPVKVRSLQTSHVSEIMTDVLSARAVLIGTPTLNNGMLPTVGAFLTYLRGLRPQNRIGFAFGSYGWGGQGAQEVAGFIESIGWDMPVDLMNVRYRPEVEQLEEAEAAGRKLGEAVNASE